MGSVNIIGASILGLFSGIELLRKGYSVQIYEKRDYIGGALKSFNGIRLSKPQMFDYLVLDENKSINFENKFPYLEYEKLEVYKRIKFNNEISVDIKFGIDEVEKLFLTFANTQKDKSFVEALLYDVKELNKIESLLKKYSDKTFFNFEKWIYEKKSKNIKAVYKKVKVENIIDKVESEYLREVIKSLVNVKCSAIVLVEMLINISFYNIYNMKNIFENLKNEFLNLGGSLYLSTIVEGIEEEPTSAKIKIDEKSIESDYVICTVNNFYSLKKIFDEEFLEKEFHKTLHGGELFDSYVIINLYFEQFNSESNITRYILEKPFIDNTGSFHRKFEFSFDKNKNIGSIYIRGNYHFWEQLDEKKTNQTAYSKFILSQKFLEELKKNNSNVESANINKVEVITPYDFMLENDCIRGASRGIIPSPKFYRKIIKYKNDMQRCYFTREELGCGMYLNVKLKDSIRIINKILSE